MMVKHEIGSDSQDLLSIPIFYRPTLAQAEVLKWP